MSIDDRAARDPRIAHLAKLQGWTLRETRGCLVFEVWPLCYDRASAYLRRLDIELATGSESLAQNMIAAGLATETRHGLRMSGASERVEYLLRAKEAGRRGGKASGKSRTSNKPSRVIVRDPQGSRNPPDMVPDSASVSVPESAPDPVMVVVPELRACARPPTPDNVIPFDLFAETHDDAKGPEPEWWGNPKPKRPPKPKKGSQLPEDWHPNSKHYELASVASISCADEAEQFRDHHRAKGTVFRDWDAAFRTWLRNAKAFRRQPPQRDGGALERQLERVRQLEADEARQRAEAT